jgi:hypothetical protein
MNFSDDVEEEDIVPDEQGQENGEEFKDGEDEDLKELDF